MQGTHQKPVKNAEDDEGMISFGRLCTNFVSVVPKMWRKTLWNAEDDEGRLFLEDFMEEV